MKLQIALALALSTTSIAAFAAGPAAAPQEATPEARFVARHGEAAERIAQGVYELRDGQGRLERRSFGRHGLLWERARAREALDELLRENAADASDARIELLETRLAAYEEVLARTQRKSLAQASRNLCGTQGHTSAEASGDFAYGGGTASVQASGPARSGLAIVSVSHDHGSTSEGTVAWRKDSLGPDGVANVSVWNGGGPQFCNHVVSSASLSVFDCADGYVESTVEWPEGGCGW